MTRKCGLLVAAVAASLLAPLASGAGTAGQALPAAPGVRVLESPRDIGDLEMTDHRGQRRKLADFAGGPLLVFFGFTHCPEACPTTLHKLGLIKAGDQKLDGLRVVLISVDGERDTPEALAAFLGRFSKDFVGFTAPPDQVRTLALRFAAPFFKDPPRDGQYLVQHSTRVYALDKRGRLRAELFDASAEAVGAVGRALLAE